MREGGGAGFDDDALGAADFFFSFENLWVLAKGKVEAVGEGESCWLSGRCIRGGADWEVKREE